MLRRHKSFSGKAKKAEISLFSCARYEPIWWIYRAGWQLYKKLDSLTLEKSFEALLWSLGVWLMEMQSYLDDLRPRANFSTFVDALLIVSYFRFQFSRQRPPEVIVCERRIDDLQLRSQKKAHVVGVVSIKFVNCHQFRQSCAEKKLSTWLSFVDFDMKHV